MKYSNHGSTIFSYITYHFLCKMSRLWRLDMLNPKIGRVKTRQKISIVWSLTSCSYIILNIFFIIDLYSYKKMTRIIWKILSEEFFCILNRIFLGVHPHSVTFFLQNWKWCVHKNVFKTDVFSGFQVCFCKTCVLCAILSAKWSLLILQLNVQHYPDIQLSLAARVSHEKTLL